MSAFRVGITRPIHPDAMALLATADVEVKNLAPDESIGDLVASVDAIITHLTDRIDGATLVRGKHLRVVANVAAGYDNVAIADAERLGIAVTNTPGVLTEATADLAFALLLAVARRIPEADAALRKDERVDWTLMPDTMGMDVSGQTLGIVGMGRIGLAVAQRAMRGFEMSVIYTGGSGKSAARAQALGARPVAFDELLAESDFLSIHAPLNERTHHLIDEPALRKMRPSAVIINTARGAVIDEQALVRSLRDKVIAGAGLDVYENEPIVLPDLLRLRERVVIAPHIGSATMSTRRRMSMIAVENVLAVASGNEPINPVSARTNTERAPTVSL